MTKSGQGTKTPRGHAERHGFRGCSCAQVQRLRAVSLPDDVLAELTGDGLPGLRSRSVVTWETPDRGEALFGVGTAWQAAGPDEATLADAIPVLRATAHASADGAGIDPLVRPRFFGGCRFDSLTGKFDPAWAAFGGWQFLVPRFLIAATGEGFAGSIILREGEQVADIAPGGGLSPAAGAGGATEHCTHGLDPARWCSAVDAALGEIAAGHYEKVVLARQVRRPCLAPASELVGRLARRYPGCFVFSMRGGGATWLGASPELLVRLQDGDVETASLAGSGLTPGASSNPGFAEDRKIRHEHNVVLTAMKQTLRAFCKDVHVPDAPDVVRLPNIEHIRTPIRARAMRGVDVLDLVEGLHPTPAVGGWPREAARRAIARLEQMDRGWYAAPIGWMDFDGNGEFAVALRCALVNGDEATLYAGAGIVEGSVPEDELAETEAKLRPILEALS